MRLSSMECVRKGGAGAGLGGVCDMEPCVPMSVPFGAKATVRPTCPFGRNCNNEMRVPREHRIEVLTVHVVPVPTIRALRPRGSLKDFAVVAPVVNDAGQP